MIKLASCLHDVAVVAVNEYKPTGMPVGHLNLSFYYHGLDQGTYGLNSAGRDFSDRVHKGKPGLGKIPGGVFSEDNDGAMTHYVIVSDKNYHSMFSYAQSQAKLTIANKLHYEFLSTNCADFAYRVFQHSDLPMKYRRVVDYLKRRNEPVALYAAEADIKYEDFMKGHQGLARAVSHVETLADVGALQMGGPGFIIPLLH